jgi:hypothetical protein
MTRPSSKRSSSRTADDARSITTSLQRSQKLLQHELERVSHVTEAIQEDGKLLGATTSHHHELANVAGSANKALRQLELEKQKERLVFLAAVFFYVLVVVYVLWTRIPLFGVDYILGFMWNGVGMLVTKVMALKDQYITSDVIMQR